MVKLTLSWQEPQAARLGLVYQALACAAPVVCSWQDFALQHAGKELPPPLVGNSTVGPVRNRVIETDDEILAARLHAGQVGAIVQLMDEHFHVHGVAAAGIGGLGGVAHDAKLHAAARSAVERELIVALIAGLRLDHITGYGDLGAVRHEVEDLGVVLRAHVELGQVAGAVNAHGVGRGLFVIGGKLFGESVNVFAIRHLGISPAGIRRGLDGIGHLGLGSVCSLVV